MAARYGCINSGQLSWEDLGACSTRKYFSELSVSTLQIKEEIAILMNLLTFELYSF